MSEFFRFPHTPHIAWLGPGTPRDDKVISPEEAREFLSHDLVVEEKVDGANLGFSVNEQGELQAQNRGTYLHLDAPKEQFKVVKRWLTPKAERLVDALFPDLMLFGEWCYAVHSVRYSHLPDWFLAFDVYDRSSGEFWSADRRNTLVQDLELSSVPRLGQGRFDLGGLKALLGQSHVTDGPAEGLYARREEAGRLVSRAKLVRAEFVQGIEEHWSKRQIEQNRLRLEGAPTTVSGSK
jgi:hypothetical protein